MYNLPVYLWVVILVGTIGVPALTTVALYRGAAQTGRSSSRGTAQTNLPASRDATQANLPASRGTAQTDLLSSRNSAQTGIDREPARLLATVAAVLLGGWLLLSGVIAGRGWYDAPLGQQPPWLLVVVVGVAVALLAATRIPLVANAIAAPGTLGRLHLPHTMRVAGVVFVLMMALGHLPALFALPAGLGDMATGIAAPFVVRRLARGTGHRAAVWFNALGIADLVVALTLGGLTSFQLIAVTPSAQAIAELPLALIPTTTVPLLLALHITSLRRLAAVAKTHPTGTWQLSMEG
ncbi:MAG TPA: hypothetical protein VH333_10620 [Pseudonocardiaceae bacterium]|jgi:hypothetical protein|nr:hypothetical protein [Pseudonocardiaceae bacterium]